MFLVLKGSLVSYNLAKCLKPQIWFETSNMGLDSIEGHWFELASCCEVALGGGMGHDAG